MRMQHIPIPVRKTVSKDKGVRYQKEKTKSTKQTVLPAESTVFGDRVMTRPHKAERKSEDRSTR